MTVLLEFSDGTTEALPLARAEMLARSYEAVPVVRAAFTSEWNADSYPNPTAARMRVSYRVTDPYGISAARVSALSVLESIDAAVLVSTPYGAWVIAGVESVVDTPAPLGYDVTVTIVCREPRYATAAAALRLIAGSVWELR